MKICAISDIHGQFNNLQIEKSDLLFICGDIVPLRMQRNIPQSFKWFKQVFIPWCEEQPVEFIYMVWGNHDFLGNIWHDKCLDAVRNTKITILNDSGAIFIDSDTGKSYTIWGSPLCHIFGDWAFMYSDEHNKLEFEKIPDNCDFLLTHDAAYKHSDQCLGFSDDYEKTLHRGNIPLQEIVEKRKPKYHLFGHLHTCDHNLIDYNGTLTACVSLLNEQYTMYYKPLYLEI